MTKLHLELYLDLALIGSVTVEWGIAVHFTDYKKPSDRETGTPPFWSLTGSTKKGSNWGLKLNGFKNKMTSKTTWVQEVIGFR